MKIIIPAILFMAVGCSTTGYMRDALPTSPPGQTGAKIVFYRTSVLGGVDNFPVYEYVEEDGKLLGFTETGCYFEYHCLPGKHFFLTWGEGDAFIQAELAAGKTYFIQAWSKFGLVSSRPGFAPVPRDSEAYHELMKGWPDLRCRELNPDKVAEYEMRKEERVQKARAAYEAGIGTAKPLKSDEGQPSPPPQP